jgi:hypothetical protein
VAKVVAILALACTAMTTGMAGNVAFMTVPLLARLRSPAFPRTLSGTGPGAGGAWPLAISAAGAVVADIVLAAVSQAGAVTGLAAAGAVALWAVLVGLAPLGSRPDGGGRRARSAWLLAVLLAVAANLAADCVMLSR